MQKYLFNHHMRIKQQSPLTANEFIQKILLKVHLPNSSLLCKWKAEWTQGRWGQKYLTWALDAPARVKWQSEKRGSYGSQRSWCYNGERSLDSLTVCIQLTSNHSLWSVKNYLNVSLSFKETPKLPSSSFKSSCQDFTGTERQDWAFHTQSTLTCQVHHFLPKIFFEFYRQAHSYTTYKETARKQKILSPEELGV